MAGTIQAVQLCHGSMLTVTPLKARLSVRCGTRLVLELLKLRMLYARFRVRFHTGSHPSLFSVATPGFPNKTPCIYDWYDDKLIEPVCLFRLASSSFVTRDAPSLCALEIGCRPQDQGMELKMRQA